MPGPPRPHVHGGNILVNKFFHADRYGPVCAHRKRAAGKDPFPDLDEAGARLVRLLSIFLIPAERLDRGHSGLVRSARFAKGEKGIELRVETTASCPIELEAVKRSRKLLAKAFGRPVDVVLLPF